MAPGGKTYRETLLEGMLKLDAPEEAKELKARVWANFIYTDGKRIAAQRKRVCMFVFPFLWVIISLLIAVGFSADLKSLALVCAVWTLGVWAGFFFVIQRILTCEHDAQMLILEYRTTRSAERLILQAAHLCDDLFRPAFGLVVSSTKANHEPQ